MAIAHYPQPAPNAPALAKVSIFGAILASLMAAGCSSSGTRDYHDAPRYAPATALSAKSNDVLIRAIGLVGTPYRYGGNTPKGGFDCSGLVDYVFLDAAGLRLPRSTRELIEIDAPTVRREHLQPGDLLFFNPGGGKASHIGIYVGESRFVHAPSAGGTVRLESLQTEYWTRYYAGAKRVLR